MSSTIRPARPSRIVVLAMVSFAALALVLPARTFAPVENLPVGACESHAHCATEGGAATSEPCIHSPRCGGGAPLAAGSGLLLAVLGAAIVLAAPSLVRTLQAFDGTRRGRLAAAQIFRPPRLSI